MIEDGFISLSRKLFADESWLWKMKMSDKLIAITVIAMANFKDQTWHDGQEVVEVPRGTFISSVSGIAKRAGFDVTDKMVRGTLRRLSKANFLKTVTSKGKRYSVITILNYEHYQTPSKTPGKTPVEVRARLGQGEGEVRATSNKGIREEGNKEKEHSLSKATPLDGGGKVGKELPERAIKGADYLRKRIIEKDPKHKLAHIFTNSQRTTWAESIDKLNRIDEKSWEEIGQVINWLHATENNFVIFSGASLRKKFDHVRTAMKRDQGPALLNGHRKLPPPKPIAPAVTGPRETREQFEARLAREKEESA